MDSFKASSSVELTSLLCTHIYTYITGTNRYDVFYAKTGTSPYKTIVEITQILRNPDCVSPFLLADSANTPSAQPVLSPTSKSQLSPRVKAHGAQNTEVIFNPLCVPRKLLSLPTSHSGQMFRHDKVQTGCVWIQTHRSVGGHLIHLVPHVKGQFAQVFGHVCQDSWGRLWVILQGALLESFRCGLIVVQEWDIFSSQLHLCVWKSCYLSAQNPNLLPHRLTLLLLFLPLGRHPGLLFLLYKLMNLPLCVSRLDLNGFHWSKFSLTFSKAPLCPVRAPEISGALICDPMQLLRRVWLSGLCVFYKSLRMWQTGCWWPRQKSLSFSECTLQRASESQPCKNTSHRLFNAKEWLLLWKSSFTEWTLACLLLPSPALQTAFTEAVATWQQDRLLKDFTVDRPAEIPYWQGSHFLRVNLKERQSQIQCLACQQVKVTLLSLFSCSSRTNVDWLYTEKLYIICICSKRHIFISNT